MGIAAPLVDLGRRRQHRSAVEIRPCKLAQLVGGQARQPVRCADSWGVGRRGFCIRRFGTVAQHQNRRQDMATHAGCRAIAGRGLRPARWDRDGLPAGLYPCVLVVKLLDLRVGHGLLCAPQQALVGQSDQGVIIERGDQGAQAHSITPASHCASLSGVMAAIFMPSPARRPAICASI